MSSDGPLVRRRTRAAAARSVAAVYGTASRDGDLGLSADEVARLDEIRGEGVSRSAFVRELIRRAGPLDEEPSYHEALVLLAKSARAGKVQAQVALERALRAEERSDPPASCEVAP